MERINTAAMLTTEQVAAILNVKAGTLEKARSTGVGDFPPFIRFCRTVRYVKADVDAWIASHRVDLREGMA
ncbi:helix-turn-helix domain-containing protein [Duganella sp. FT3S]|uniref:Helix-turn-helix domain-containing protein n=1 Tax=Rugamonas fusca TaxID=2758568 RepID=A0A7W2EI04_9BURK|nr:helix-turn-helix domain-containing protein [Rugamonas fusca]